MMQITTDARPRVSTMRGAAEELIGWPFFPPISPKLDVTGFDVLRAETHGRPDDNVVYRCQACAFEESAGLRADGALVVRFKRDASGWAGPPRIGTITLRTPPAGWIAARVDDDPERVNRLLWIHRLRMHPAPAEVSNQGAKQEVSRVRRWLRRWRGLNEGGGLHLGWPLWLDVLLVIMAIAAVGLAIAR